MSQSVSNYTSLVTSEYANSTNFLDTISVSVQPFVDGQNVLLGMPEGYDLDNAVGAQLDAVGLWIGITRYVNIPLSDVYFSWDTSGLGWDQGYWKGEFDPSQGVSALNDTVYRFVLQAKAASNHWDGTMPGAAVALANIFNSTDTPGTLLYIEDKQNMSILFGLAGVQPPQIYQSLLTNGTFLLSPGGIPVEYVMTSLSGSPVFGLDSFGSYVAGLDEGAWAISI
jgi:hypothetical protein